jgi:hypothetical protein
MFDNRYKLLFAIVLLVAAGLACESFSAISRDYTEIRGTAESIATQADKIITQAKGIATEIGDDKVLATAKAIATEQGPSLLATGETLATQAAEDGYLETVEALVTQGPRDLVPTFQAVATQYLFPAPPPDDIPIISGGDISNLFTNQATVSYYVSRDLPSVISFYRNTMPEYGWTDVSDANSIRDEAAVLKFFKPDRVATITLTENPLNLQTIVLITITNQ